MKSTPAHHRAADVHESLVDVVALVEPGPEPAELVQQRVGLLDHVAQDPEVGPQ